jgi:SAM-dependent methyltransferase
MEYYEPRNCPRCASPSSHVRLTGRDNSLSLDGLYYVSRCDDCGLLYQNPMPRAEFLAKHYPEEYAPYEVSEIWIGPETRWYLSHYMGYRHLDGVYRPRRLRRMLLRSGLGKQLSLAQLIPEYVPGGSLLELGCASGNRLSLLRSLGWEACTGIEYSEHAARLARERGFAVHTGMVEDALGAFPDESQDAIVSSFMMEHLADPFAVTEQIASKLRPGGQFLFSTLDVNSPDFALWREYWYDLDLPRHLTFFRRSDLYQMLSKSFEVKEVRYQFASNDYVGSARYRSRHQRKLLDKIVIGLDERINILYKFLALVGWATRICISARKR